MAFVSLRILFEPFVGSHVRIQDASKVNQYFDSELEHKTMVNNEINNQIFILENQRQ